MIEVIAEHSIDLSLLPKEAQILDLGARGFQFTHALRNLGHHVCPVDMDRLDEGQAYYRVAISDKTGRVGMVETTDPQARRISGTGGSIESYTLDDFTFKILQKEKGFRWDAIKMDIEGEEYPIIMTQKRPPARQWSIEFHLHVGLYGLAEMALMEAKLAQLGYKAVSHEKTSQHGAGFNYWDSLFILQ